MKRIAILLLLAFSASIANAQGPGGYTVIDGDTIHAPYGVKYRLLGFDTPETFRAECQAERALGLAAKRRLEELIASGEARIIESGRTDRYGRSLAHLEINGRDAGEILISEGLARAYHGGRRRGWCGQN